MADGIQEKIQDVLRKSTALGRLGKSEEFASCVTGVCMNSYITGEVIRLDGGQRMPHI